VWHLSVAYIRPKSRTERPRKTKIGTEVAHVTRDSDTTFKVNSQGHQATLLTAVLEHQAAAAVDVSLCWPWETAPTLPSAQWHKALRRPREAYSLSLIGITLVSSLAAIKPANPDSPGKIAVAVAVGIIHCYLLFVFILLSFNSDTTAM